MNSRPRFRSSIPTRAEARIVGRHPDGAQARVSYILDGAVVGFRDFDAEGHLTLDSGFRGGSLHGTTYRLEIPGCLLSATPYRHGLEHGLARQWSDEGRLIGWYRMINGTGVDLWWGETWARPRRPYVQEVHFTENGQPHGYEWWLNGDQRSIHRERHWSRGEWHGVEREWNATGALRRGFPKYFVHGEQVSRAAYLRACATDPWLPALKREDNRPQRSFPAIVSRRLSRRLSQG